MYSREISNRVCTFSRPVISTTRNVSTDSGKSMLWVRLHCLKLWPLLKWSEDLLSSMKLQKEFRVEEEKVKTLNMDISRVRTSERNSAIFMAISA